MLLVWSLLLGLALAGAGWYVDQGRPADSNSVRAMEDGTPPPPR